MTSRKLLLLIKDCVKRYYYAWFIFYVFIYGLYSDDGHSKEDIIFCQFCQHFDGVALTNMPTVSFMQV